MSTTVSDAPAVMFAPRPRYVLTPELLGTLYDGFTLLAVWLCMVVWFPTELSSFAWDLLERGEAVQDAHDMLTRGNSQTWSNKVCYAVIALYALVRWRSVLQFFVAIPPVIRTLMISFVVMATTAHLIRSGFEGIFTHMVSLFRYGSTFVVMPILFYRGFRVVPPNLIALGMLVSVLVLVQMVMSVSMMRPEVARFSFLAGMYPNLTAQHFLAIAGLSMIFLGHAGLSRRLIAASLLTMAPLCGLMVFLSGSRGGFALIFVALALTMVLAYLRNPGRWTPVWFVLSCLMAFLIWSAEDLSTMMPAETMAVFERKGYDDDALTGRGELWSHYLGHLAECTNHLFFGIAYGETARAGGAPHNFLIGLSIEHGVLAALPLLLMVGLVFGHAFRLAMVSNDPAWQAVFVIMTITLIMQSFENDFHLMLNLFVFTFYCLGGYVIFRVVRSRYPDLRF